MAQCNLLNPEPLFKRKWCWHDEMQRAYPRMHALPSVARRSLSPSLSPKPTSFSPKSTSGLKSTAACCGTLCSSTMLSRTPWLSQAAPISRRGASRALRTSAILRFSLKGQHTAEFRNAPDAESSYQNSVDANVGAPIFDVDHLLILFLK